MNVVKLKGLKVATWIIWEVARSEPTSAFVTFNTSTHYTVIINVWVEATNKQYSTHFISNFIHCCHLPINSAFPGLAVHQDQWRRPLMSELWTGRRPRREKGQFGNPFRVWIVHVQVPPHVFWCRILQTILLPFHLSPNKKPNAFAEESISQGLRALHKLWAGLTSHFTSRISTKKSHRTSTDTVTKQLYRGAF